jgi:hypothetical protein
MAQPSIDPTSSIVVNALFERLAGQLNDLAASEKELQAELKNVAAGVKQADQRKLVNEALAQHATFADQATSLATALGSTKQQVVSDLATLTKLASRKR